MKLTVNVEKLQELLALKGYNKYSFSRASGISDETLRKILKDEVSSPKMAKRISEALEIDLTEVFSLAWKQDATNKKSFALNKNASQSK